ncbi:MAG: DedA family protein [Phycisphaerae bacterium]
MIGMLGDIDVVGFFLHLDEHLDAFIQQYGDWTYLALFLVIFAETGFVVTPFLPGDSLLFAAGAIAGRGTLDPHLLFVLLASSALLGNSSNYFIGKFLGPRLLRDQSRFLKREYLDRTHAFFERHGGKTIIMARFVPIVRTFAPFVAGVGKMTYRRFVSFDVFGATLWVGACVYAGYFFGGFEIVKKNFSIVVLAIIAVSLLPAMIEFLRHRRGNRREPAQVALKKADKEEVSQSV